MQVVYSLNPVYFIPAYTRFHFLLLIGLLPSTFRFPILQNIPVIAEESRFYFLYFRNSLSEWFRKADSCEGMTGCFLLSTSKVFRHIIRKIGACLQTWSSSLV